MKTTHTRTVTWAGVVASILAFAVGARADQITLKNGDRISGSIVKKDADKITIKTEAFGEITADWSKVEAVNADTPVNVVLQDGSIVKGTVKTNEGTVEVSGSGTTKAAKMAEVQTIRDEAEQKTYERLLRPRWTDLWTVSGSLSVAGASGNAKTFTLLIPVTAARVTRHDAMNVRFGLIRSSALVNGQTETTARAIRAGWAYNRNLSRRIFWNLFNDYEYDRFQNLDLRIVLGSGFGVSIWKRESSSLDLVGGLAWNRESFSPPSPTEPFTRNALEAYWGNNWLWKVNQRMTFTQSYRMFNTLTDSGGQSSGGFRQNFDLNLTTRLTRWLTWNAAVTDRYLQHPVAGNKKNDIIYATGLGFTAAR